MTDNVYTDFVASLPETWQTAAMNDTVSTAFYLALRAGWTPEQLSGDAFMSLTRGGMGLVVTRFRQLAESPRRPNKPAQVTSIPLRNQQRQIVPECIECGQPYRRNTLSDPSKMCVGCGSPLQMRTAV